MRSWRCQYMAGKDAPQMNGALIVTTSRLIFLEERRGEAQAYVLKFSVSLRDIRNISTEGLVDKKIIINGQTGPNPWMLMFDDIYDIDQASFYTTNKVDLNWMQAWLMEKKAQAR